MPRNRPAIEVLENRLLLARPLGIDVSSFQATINWNSVKNGGYTFGWTKATEGFTFNDTTYSNHIAGANAANFLIAPYHYARPDNNSPQDEVSHFLSIVGNEITAGPLVPMVDFENPVDPNDAVNTKAELSAWLNQWCNAFLTATGVRPIIYTYQSYASTWLDSTVTQWPLWMAQYPTSPDPQTGHPAGTAPWSSSSWVFWQYSSTTSVPGISGNCDVDVFNGTAAQLNSWIIMSAPTTPTPADNAALTGSPSTLDWADVANATSYDVYVDGALKANVATSQWTVSPALANGAHTWQIKANNNTGTKAGPTWNFNVNPAVVLNQPTNPVASNVTDTNVTLQWNDTSTGEQNYLVERKTGAAGLWSQVSTLAANSTSWNDTLAQPGTTYYYRVRASAAGPTYGPYSSEINTTTLASVPTGIDASDGSFTTKIHVAWNAAPGAVSYQLYRGTDNDPLQAGLLAPSSTNSYDDTSAAPGTTYYYFVASKDSLNRTTAKSAGDAGLRAVDSTPPAVMNDAFDYIEPAQPITFAFSEDVSSTIATANLTVQNLDTLANVPVVDFAYDSATNTATYFMTPILPDGNYRATLDGSQVTDAQGNPLGTNVVLDFYFMAGDANHDRSVDTTDFNLLAASFGVSPASFDHGDFNYDNTVDSLDFNILAAKFSQSLPSASSAPAAARPGSDPVAPQPSRSLFGDRAISSPALVDDLL